MWILRDNWEGDEDVPAAFKRHALAKHASRWEFMKFPVHCASYAFSPDYHDENIFGIAEVMRETREMLRFFAPNAADYQQALREFRDYKVRQDDLLFPKNEENNKIDIGISPVGWWQVNGAEWPALQPIAVRILSVGTSSSASERNFSTWNHIWSNRANRLNFQRTVKLVFVYSNLRMLAKLHSGTARTDHVKSYWLETEIEE